MLIGTLQCCRIVIKNIHPNIGLRNGGARKHFQNLLMSNGVCGCFIRRTIYSRDSGVIEVIAGKDKLQALCNIFGQCYDCEGNKLWEFVVVKNRARNYASALTSSIENGTVDIVDNLETEFCGAYSGDGERELSC